MKVVASRELEPWAAGLDAGHEAMDATESRVVSVGKVSVVPTTAALWKMLKPSRPASGGCTQTTKRCDVESWKAGGVRPDCCTRHMLELLTFVHELLERHGIRHWLDYGTLLGAVRTGELIAWDDDIDIGMFASDLDRLRELGPEIEAAGFHTDLTLAAYDPHVHYSRVNELFLDLRPWSPQDGLLVHDKSTQHDWPGMQDRGFFPVEYVEQLGQVQLHGHTYPAPSHVHDFLRDYRYGPDYLTPHREVLGLYHEILMTSDVFTPRAQELYHEIAEREAQVAQAARSRFLVLRTNLLGINDALCRFIMAPPQKPSPERLAATLDTIAKEDLTPTVEHLARMKATLDTVLDEIENPSLGLALRRMWRRVGLVLRRIRRRALAQTQFAVRKTLEHLLRSRAAS